MADIREAFPTLQDNTTLEGKVLDARVEGDAAAAMTGNIGFSFKDSSGNVVLPVQSSEGDSATGVAGFPSLAFKDSSGNLVLPTLTPEGKIPVDFMGAGTIQRVRGELAAGSLTMVQVTGAELTLAAGKVYHDLSMVVSCRRDAHFQLIQVNDATETILLDAILGPGQFSAAVQLAVDEITAGSTGTQKLIIKAMNFEKVSALRASLSAVQEA
jgi:hypothetical protein